MSSTFDFLKRVIFFLAVPVSVMVTLAAIPMIRRNPEPNIYASNLVNAEIVLAGIVGYTGVFSLTLNFSCVGNQLKNSSRC